MNILKLHGVKILVVILINIDIAYSQKNFINISDIAEKYLQSSAMSYNGIYHIKYSSREDTISISGRVELIKDSTDSIYGGLIWIEVPDLQVRYYDGDEIYFIEFDKKLITENDAKKGQLGPISGSFVGSLREIMYFNFNNLIVEIESGKNKVFFETIADSTSKITVEFPNEDNYDKIVSTYYINSDSILYQIEFEVHSYDEIQYSKWELSNVEFDKSNLANYSLEQDKRFSNYAWNIFRLDPMDEIDITLGISAPYFKGRNVENTDSLSLSDFKNKTVILFFSYSNCYPCLKAIPVLNSISEKYKDQDVVILELNSIDGNKPNSIEVLRNFIKKREMNFPIVLIDEEIDSIYSISAYPTIVIIDNSGKVRFSYLGYNENYKDLIEKELELIIP